MIGVMQSERPTVHHLVFDTAIGPCGVAWTERGLVGLQVHDATAAAIERRLADKSRSAGPAEPPPWVATVIADLKRYFAGEPVDFAAVAVDLSGVDPYRRKLYEAMRSLAWGETTTYGELARHMGSTDWEGAREVGDAMGRNPVPVVIPCHRVLAAGGKVGGFSAPGGIKSKIKLLALEGVHLDGGAPRLPGF